MNSASNNPARNTKIMNRFDLTSRLIAKLKNEEAVVGGIGNTNFDLWAAGHRPHLAHRFGRRVVRDDLDVPGELDVGAHVIHVRVRVHDRRERPVGDFPDGSKERLAAPGQLRVHENDAAVADERQTVARRRQTRAAGLDRPAAAPQNVEVVTDLLDAELGNRRRTLWHHFRR